MESTSASQQLYDMKRRVSEMVRVRFARYGDGVLAIILGYALQPVRMPQLMDRLGIRANTRSVEDALDALAGYLATNGPQEFTRRAMNIPAREQVKPIDVEKLEAHTAPPPSPPPLAAETSLSTPVPTVPPDDDATMINVPGYSGPERRRGERRRQCRREGLAATNRNKRFGGDRRKEPRGRRAEDRTRPERWWRLLGEKDASILLPFLNKKN